MTNCQAGLNVTGTSQSRIILADALRTLFKILITLPMHATAAAVRSEIQTTTGHGGGLHRSAGHGLHLRPSV